MGKDIFGMAFNDYLQGDKEGIILVHTDNFETEELEVAYFFRNIDELPEHEQDALNMCEGRILDVGAGAGCHSVLLKEKNADIHPMDISEGAVEVMKKRGLDTAFCKDFFEIKDEKYDVLLLLMDSIGLVGKLSNLPNFFKQAKSLLNPSGRIIFNSADMIHHLMDDDGEVMLDLNASYYGEVEYVLEYQGQKGEAFNWIFIDFENIEDVAKDYGFESEIKWIDEQGNYVAELILKD